MDYVINNKDFRYIIHEFNDKEKALQFIKDNPTKSVSYKDGVFMVEHKHDNRVVNITVRVDIISNRMFEIGTFDHSFMVEECKKALIDALTINKK